ncbi:MAG: phosphoenolpyruvate--protein phosphotransferase [Pseudomonadales bacterium]|nr:phosphoenolpyruvate--protein phosphotransferase [Pseudomonadales bacterium]
MKNVIQELTHIVQAVSLASSPDEQVTLMVESISKTMAVDVCSLYLVNEQGEMILLASHGLAAQAVRKVKLPAGKGLVGLVASSRHPVNIADAEQHPTYYYVAETEEERFHGFCAVPLVSSGKVIGVLVVQTSEKRQFSKDEEGFLVTLGAQLALMLENYEVPVDDIERNIRVRGVKGAPGVAVGFSILCDHGELYEVANSPCDNIEEAVREWHQLIAEVSAQIDKEQLSLGDEVSEGVGGIFNAYKLLLNDSSFVGEVEASIRENNWLPGALKQTIQYFSELFLSMDDPYLQARHEDIHHLGNKLFNVWRGVKALEHDSQEDIVLMGRQISISDIAAAPADRLKAIVCFSGSGLSHTAVLANALGIPAVMGTGPISGLAERKLLIVDGDQGQVYISPNDLLLKEYRKLILEGNELTRQLQSLRLEPAVSTDHHRVDLYTNTGLLTDISPGLNNGAQGVGLYRTEIPFLIRDSFPTEEEQVEVYRQVLTAYAGKPVYMRTLDIGGDKQLPYFPISDEENPALGWRGIRFTLDNSPLLMTQVRAMLIASEGINNLHLLLPMVTSIREIDEFKSILSDACSQLKESGRKIKRPRLGIMIEVPAMISQIGFLKGKVNFISIGSNDLSQYLLALDRNNARVASRYDHVHPAVLHELKRILVSAKAINLPVSLCGEMAADPIAVMLLLGLGLRTLSMSAAKLPYIKWLIRNLSIAQSEIIVEKALKMDNPQAIRSFVGQKIKDLGLAELIR